MSLTDDLALVTACREHVAPLPEHWSTVQITSAALSLIEDTLNRHRPITLANGVQGCHNGCAEVLPSLRVWPVEHPCGDYHAHLTALHTIATALGVEVPV